MKGWLRRRFCSHSEVETVTEQTSKGQEAPPLMTTNAAGLADPRRTTMSETSPELLSPVPPCAHEGTIRVGDGCPTCGATLMFRANLPEMRDGDAVVIGIDGHVFTSP